jgi:hypothetical protein
MPVGQTSKGVTSGATSVATTGVNTTASGSAFLVLVGFTADTINGSPSGNTWTQIGSETAIGSSDKARAYYVENGAGGSNHVVTLTLDSSVGQTILLIELTGVETSGVLDGSSLSADTSSPYVSGGVTTTVADTILVGGLIGNAGITPSAHAISGATPSSGWTIHTAAEETGGSSFWAGALASVTVASTSTYSSGFTEDNSTGAAVLLAAFKLAAGAPTINAQPADAQAYNNDAAAFSVSATASAGSLSYQWQVSTDRCVSFSDVSGGSGATTASYTTASLLFADHETFYRCAVTDDNGTTNTRGAALRIKPRASAAWLRGN